MAKTTQDSVVCRTVNEHLALASHFYREEQRFRALKDFVIYGLLGLLAQLQPYVSRNDTATVAIGLVITLVIVLERVKMEPYLERTRKRCNFHSIQVDNQILCEMPCRMIDPDDNELLSRQKKTRPRCNDWFPKVGNLNVFVQKVAGVLQETRFRVSEHWTAARIALELAILLLVIPLLIGLWLQHGEWTHVAAYHVLGASSWYLPAIFTALRNRSSHDVFIKLQDSARTVVNQWTNQKLSDFEVESEGRRLLTELQWLRERNAPVSNFIYTHLRTRNNKHAEFIVRQVRNKEEII